MSERLTERRGHHASGVRDRAAAMRIAGEPLQFLRNAVVYEGEDCLIWPYARLPNGYGGVRIDGKRKLPHREVCKAAHGPPPTNRHQAAHSCNNGHGGCISPNHLSWKTPIENVADTLRAGNFARGSKSGRAKLNEEIVLQIRKIYPSMNQREIAEKFKVRQSLVSRILSRKIWREI